jgi:hypothetical protein
VRRGCSVADPPDDLVVVEAMGEVAACPALPPTRLAALGSIAAPPGQGRAATMHQLSSGVDG